MKAVRRLLWGVIALVPLQYVAGAVLFLAYPDGALPRKADAVVVLAGSESRLPVALDLMEQRVAPELLVSDDTPSDDHARERFCAAAHHPFPVTCRRPDPFSTRGEARMTAELAGARGWDTIVVVTSRFHLFRSRILFRRCTDAGVILRGSPEPWYLMLKQVPLEWVKLVVAETARRGC
jgi:uncharacterized SAM-binding protein YcdF (DUF218 family)